MAYLGNDLQVAYQSYQIIDDISGSFNGVLTSFALQVGGVTPVPFPINPQQCLISVNGVIQEPDPSGTSGFNLVGSNIVFASAPTGGHTFFGVILAGADYVNVGVNYPSGSQSAPSITFDTDLDTGLFNPAANEIAITTNSTKRFNIDSSGQVEISAAGSAASPALVFNTDINTGIYSPGADQLAISTNGTGRLFVDSSGRVGVGTASPSGNTNYGSLTLNGSAGGEIFFSTAGVAKGNIFNYSAAPENLGIAATEASGQIIFNTGGYNERARIDSSGRLGLGTSTPGSYDGNSSDLVIANTSGNAGMSIVTTSTGDGTISWADGTTGNEKYRGSIGYSHTNDKFTISTAATSAVTIDSSQRVGIGTTSPGAPLDISGDNGSGRVVRFSGVNDGVFQVQNVSTDLVGIGATGTGDDLAFLSNGSEQARIDSSGRLLVGTSTASQSSGNGVKINPSGQVWVVSTGGDTFSAYNGGYKFYVNSIGEIAATSATITVISDQRFKENIRDLDDGLGKILALQPRKFDWKEGRGSGEADERGFIAQEFEQVFPDLISEWKDAAPEGEEPYKAVRADLIPVLVKAIQEQQAMIVELQAKVAALKGA